MERNATPLLRLMIDVVTGATLLDVAQVMLNAAGKFWCFLVFPFRTASREEPRRVLPG